MPEAVYFDSPAFRVSFSLENAVSQIESMLKKKHWHNLKVAEMKLSYVPYWCCSYDAYSEDDKKNVHSLKSGKVALNALTNQIDAKISRFLEENAETENSQAEYPFEFRTTDMEKAEAQNAITVRIASDKKVPREKVMLSGLVKRYVPFWITSVTVDEGNIRLMVNACNGQIIGEENIPEREKGWLEITSETIEDLKKPEEWLNYTAAIGGTLFSATTDAVSGAGNAPVQQANNNEFWTSPLFIVLLGIIAIIAAMYALGYF